MTVIVTVIVFKSLVLLLVISPDLRWIIATASKKVF
jgi:hypothetical protein